MLATGVCADVITGGPMRGYRIVDLSLPILDGGGFLMPARMTYLSPICARAGAAP
jgi:hypothetical protein